MSRKWGREGKKEGRPQCFYCLSHFFVPNTNISMKEKPKHIRVCALLPSKQWHTELPRVDRETIGNSFTSTHEINNK